MTPSLDEPQSNAEVAVFLDYSRRKSQVILDQAAAGQTVLISRRSVIVAELGPVVANG
jgi:antitoxin (DNA-binding transcriptional repressor) of toxin-antitoxin stability system